MYNDYSHADYLEKLMRELRMNMAVLGAVRMYLCPVCNVYGKPKHHLCSTSEVKAIG